MINSLGTIYTQRDDEQNNSRWCRVKSQKNEEDFLETKHLGGADENQFNPVRFILSNHPWPVQEKKIHFQPRKGPFLDDTNFKLNIQVQLREG